MFPFRKKVKAWLAVGAGIWIMGNGACSPQPQPIRYGEDVCAYCKMTVVDQRYGSELVTTKGKVYTFDAIECMVNYLHDHPEERFAHRLVTHFTNPGKLAPAETSIYLITEQLPSPMRADINAFPDRATAEEYQRKYGGTIYTWDELSKMKFGHSGGHSM